MSKSNSEEAQTEITARIEALDRFAFDPNSDLDDEIQRLNQLLCALHTGQQTPMRYALQTQIETIKRSLPRVLSEFVPHMLERFSDSEPACHLVYHALPQFLISTGKLNWTRMQQSASGRGVFGRQTVATLQARIAELEAEKAGRQGEEETATG